MNTIAGPYVNVPNLLKLTDDKLEYLDALTYASLRSFDNEIDGCFAKHKTIGKRVGLSKNFVIDSVKRLELAQLISVDRSDKKRVSNQYNFVVKDNGVFLPTHKVPLALFDANDLSKNEKAMFICLRQFFDHGLLTSSDTIPYFTEWLGLSYSTVSKQFSALLNKGYITEKQVIYKGGSKCQRRYYITDKINWDYHEMELPHKYKKTVLPILKVA